MYRSKLLFLRNCVPYGRTMYSQNIQTNIRNAILHLIVIYIWIMRTADVWLVGYINFLLQYLVLRYIFCSIYSKNWPAFCSLLSYNINVSKHLQEIEFFLLFITITITSKAFQILPERKHVCITKRIMV